MSEITHLPLELKEQVLLFAACNSFYPTANNLSEPSELASIIALYNKNYITSHIISRLLCDSYYSYVSHCSESEEAGIVLFLEKLEKELPTIEITPALEFIRLLYTRPIVRDWVRNNHFSVTQWAADIACQLNDARALKFLHELGITSQREQILATIHGNTDVLRYLENAGNCILEAGLLQHAAMFGHLETCRYLCSIGVEITVNVVNAAAEYGQLNVLQFLLERGGKCTMNGLNKAAENGHLDICKALNANGYKFMTKSVDLALKWEHLDVVKFLVEKGSVLTRRKYAKF